ncbi:MAG: glycosyl hydrolase family 18 protein [Flavobacteriales bacterium]
MQRVLGLFFLLFLVKHTQSQTIKSVHQEQAEEYTSLGFDDMYYESNNQAATIQKSARNCSANKVVYGWHPYWSNGLQINYDWNLLSHLCYFSYEVDANTGNAINTYNFATTPVVTTALNNGVKVHLCVTLFSNHTTFFGNPTARQTLITNLINMIQARGAHGVNIDFESMASSQSANYTAFMIDLCNQMHAAIPGSEVTTALHAVDWSGFYDMAVLNNYVDYFMIMGYDYYWSGSNPAGPNDPLFHFGSTYDYNLSKSTTYYQHQGASLSKLVMGLPYYGRDWPVSSFSLPAPTTGTGVSRTYKVVKDNTSGNFSPTNRNYESASRSTYYNYTASGVMRQCFISEENDLRERMDFINKRGLAGVGVWALGYDDGYTELWDAIAEYFSDCSETPCSGVLTDIGGGPLKNYYNNENYTFTLSPPGAQSITVNFSSFSTEANYDFLHIYDGPSTASPQIPGSPFHGTNSPGSFTSSSGHLTFRFISDNATVSPGWNATYTCQQDNIPPTTAVLAPNGWVTEDFTVNFTDADNVGGSGVDKSFYQVLEFEGTEWRANTQRGFFSDNFDQAAIHPDWTSVTGTWQITNGYLHQSNQGVGNTNIYAYLKQDLSNRYLYHWAGKMDGTGSNRRAGFHFFCDNPTLPNRGNSYFVWFRLDNNRIQIYKVVNDNFGTPVLDIPYSFSNQWTDYKVTYDRILGSMNVYVNDILAAQWTDGAPYQTGDYISFRSGDCDFMANNLKVYRTRFPSVNVTVGLGSSNEIRYENINPTQPAGRIKSIVQDVAGNLSVVASQDVNVDWTPPVMSFIHDGLSQDVDTIFAPDAAEANWSFLDTNSHVAEYFFSMGTQPLLDDVYPYTSNMLSTSASVSSGILQSGTWYYFNIIAENNAGLRDTLSSNGFRFVSLLGVGELVLTEIPRLFPNPAQTSATVGSKKNISVITVYDVLGRQVFSSTPNGTSAHLPVYLWADGIYVVRIFSEGREIDLKLIKKQ